MQKDKLFSKSVLLLILLGVAVNIGLAQLVLLLKLPVFFDSIGTILVAALGGYLPGIMVGFFSNVLNGISDPITLYYGIVSILIAAAAAWFSRRYAFRSIKKSLLAALVFAAIGGGVGSVLTWLLYGFSFGSGISAPFAVALHERFGLSEFWAQFSADMAIDVVDKLLSVAAVVVILRLLPNGLLNKLPFGGCYRKGSAVGGGSLPQTPAQTQSFFRKHSLRNEVAAMIVLTAAVLGAVSTTISFLLYKDTMTERYISTCNSAVNLMRATIDADSIEGYLAGGVETEAYRETEAQLAVIRDNIPDIEYMYAYQIRPDGCHVVFDIDTPELPGGALCDVVPHESAFAKYYDDLLAGNEIEPVISNGAYGWLLTVYRPLRDSSGRCVAYAAADISMNDVITDRYIYIIRMVSLLFGVTIIIIAFALWFADRRLVAPINSIAAAASEFAYDSEERRLKSTDMVKSLDIKTGDEIENLYSAIFKTVSDVAQYITDIDEKTRIIAQMQNNIIISFAAMVENRDANTGEHIKRTSAYVRLIAEALQREGIYGGVMSDAYIETLIRSAPLHDIGKIKISDTILNKPGRLTPEEFEQIKTHTTAGREILISAVENINSSDYLAQATDMAAYHHERWDGTGYPEGLAGEAIPLCARIMAVADVFDALISKRSYKEPMSFEQAKAIIAEEAGTHFDPNVVAAFLSVCDEARPGES